MQLDAQTIRRALSDFFKFNPKDFTVRGSSTGYLVSAVKQSTSTTTPACQLKPYILVDGEDQYVAFNWGTINGLQPDGFTAGGLTPFKIGPITVDTYFFASATFDTGSMLWTSSEIVSGSTPTEYTSTTTIAYMLIASVDVTDGVLTLSGGVCGPLNLPICSLAAS